MTTPQEQMRSIIALLESTTVEAQKPTRNALLARQRDAFLRMNKIDLGPNFAELGAHPGERIDLRWRGTGKYSKYSICIGLDESNTAEIYLHAENSNIDHRQVERIWDDANITARDKIALAICGNVGIVPGSMDQEPDASPYFPFNIAPGSALDKMTKLIPENQQQAEELTRIFNQG